MNGLNIMVAAGACLLFTTASCGDTQNEGSRKPKDLCADISIEGCCSNEGHRVLSAYQYDTINRRLFPEEAVGCIAASDFVCDDASTFAKDPCGTKWMFNDGCIPEGWEMISPIPSSPEASAPGWPWCEE